MCRPYDRQVNHGTPPARTTSQAARRVNRLLGIADDTGDSEDVARRKRVGVVAGYATIAAPLFLLLQVRGDTRQWLVLALGLSLYSVVNLAVLARTRDFDRYVVALLSAGVVFVPLATWVGGGITGSTSGLVWGFLAPAYAILALGPRRAAPWFVAFVASTGVMTVVDPLARDRLGVPSYEVQLLGQVQNALLPLSIVFVLLRYTDARRLAAEARADELLTNAIPAAIAARLRRGEHRIADSYASTTVLFADIVGFTPWAQRTPPDRVVAELDGLFTTFDELVEGHGLEKIKTIGDAYMAVAGAPGTRADHAEAAVNVARAMIELVAARRARGGIELDVRIGLASGAVVGGVIGRRRLLFDVWGDTVNLASRMESFGLPGRIQVSAATRDLLGDRCDFDAREIDVKGLGRLTAYVVR
jgi:adenylate cyclase